MYRDGVLKNIDTLENTTDVDVSSITIGENFYGKLDDIRIYNQKLSEGDVTELFDLVEDCAVMNCETGSPELSNFECLGDSAYIVTLDFDYENTSDSFDLKTRTDGVGRYAYGDLPLRLTLPFSGLADELLSITDVEMPDCEFAFEFEVDCGTTSVSDFGKPNLRIYPNPFRDHVTLRFSAAAPLNYQLITSDGRTLKEGVIRSGEDILTGQLHSGYYLLHLWGEDFDRWTPLIKAQ